MPMVPRNNAILFTSSLLLISGWEPHLPIDVYFGVLSGKHQKTPDLHTTRLGERLYQDFCLALILKVYAVHICECIYTCKFQDTEAV